MNDSKSLVPATAHQPAAKPALPPSAEHLHGSLLGEFGKDMMFWDPANPRSLVSLVPFSVRQKLEEARHASPQWFDEPDEQTNLKNIQAAGGRINATDNRLRLKFWLEYDYAMTYVTKGIDLKRVCAGICTTHYFENKYLATVEKVAWLLTPPAGYMAKVNEALEFGIQQMRDILGEDHKPMGGKLDVKLAELKFKIVQYLDVRKNGSIAMKVAHLHAHTSDQGLAHSVAQHALPHSMDQLQNRVEALRREKEALQNGGTLVLPPEAVKKVD